MNRQSIPGIKALGYVPAERLQREIMYKHLAGLPVGIFTEVTPIAFVGVPTCEAVSTYNNNGRVEQTTLRFKTLDDVPTNKHIAFVITIIKTTSTTGTPGGDPAVCSVEVTLYAQKSLIPCIQS